MRFILYPRLRRGGRVLRLSLHAVVGREVVAFALFLLIIGLPWATFWGGNLQTFRSWLAPTTQRQDWTTGSADEARRAIAQNTQPEPEHAGHNAAGHDMNMHGLHGAHDMPGMVGMAAMMLPSFDGAALDRSEEPTSELQSLMRISYAVFCLK